MVCLHAFQEKRLQYDFLINVWTEIINMTINWKGPAL